MKEFNYTGTCIPELNYMVDTRKKDDQILKLIEKGKYFTINRPRQYGKTTTINQLKNRLKNDYIVIKTSFEGSGEVLFGSEKTFCQNILKKLSNSLISGNEALRSIIEEENKECGDLEELSKAITRIIRKADKKVVLFIDEVDKASNYILFLNFLGVLRNKYLKRSEGEDYTFHSVVLAGVHDIKNIKMKIRDETESQYNSPWNIATDFDIDMNFSIEEIETMLLDYEKENNVKLDTKLLSEKIYDYTSGYPFLVTKICYFIDEKLEKNFSESGILEAIKLILNDRNNTLFDDMIKNINKYKELYELLERLVLDGEEISYNSDAHNLGIIYGILKEDKNKKLRVHNKIFEIRIYNYLIAKREMKKGSALNYKYLDKFIDKTGNLDIELVLTKFQELMKAEYRVNDERFVEREGRLLFLAFLKPIINGTGFYFVEPETRMSNRMDIVVIYNKRKFVIELKIWRGGKYEQEGREQLSAYLEAENLEKGYMIFYSFNKSKEYIISRLKVNEKEIFEIVV